MSGESGGLKQRKIAASNLNDSSYANSSSGNNNNNNSDENAKNEADKNEDEEFDADSKETRLTLMEEILLLGLKDREVGSFCWLSIKH